MQLINCNCTTLPGLTSDTHTCYLVPVWCTFGHHPGCDVELQEFGGTWGEFTAQLGMHPGPILRWYQMFTSCMLACTQETQE